MDIEVRQTHKNVWYLYLNSRVFFRINLLKSSKKYFICFSISESGIFDLSVTNSFNQYFLDWLNPTEEEFIAFCLEHDLNY